MRAEQHVDAGANRIADLLDEALAALECLDRRVARVERRVAAGRIELDGGEAALDVLDRALGREIRVVVHVNRVAGLLIEVRVRAQPLAHLAAEQVIDRLAGRLADDVPQRHLDTAEDAHHRRVGAELEAGAVDLAEHRLDAVRIHPDDAALHHVVDALDDHVGAERRDVALAVSDNPVVRDDLDEDEVVAALARGRVADNEGLPGGDLH